jgi:hypothetical protein
VLIDGTDYVFTFGSSRAAATGFRGEAGLRSLLPAESIHDIQITDPKVATRPIRGAILSPMSVTPICRLILR